EVLKKTGHWHEVIEAMDKANLSPEQEKLIMATTKNAITQASKQLNINFEKPTKKYNEDDEQGKGA
ncbi:XRE family transcriptional regulator, partial [Leuconostoc lactis]